MNYEELQQGIQDINNLIDERYCAAVDNYHKYWKECIEQKRVMVKTRPERSEFERQAQLSIDRLKKEYAMQESPADVGDVIEAETRFFKGAKMKERHYIMKIERIDIAAFEKPTLAFYGTYLNQKMQPCAIQRRKPILQPDVIKVVKLKQN